MTSDFSKKPFKTASTTHNPTPDYNRPLYEIPPDNLARMQNRLARIYGQELARRHMPELKRILQVYYAYKPQALIEREKKYDPVERFDQTDIILITYGDMLEAGNSKPLASLASFCDRYLQGVVNTLHLLPFFPYSSDRGFSVTEYTKVDPALGSWQDISDLDDRFQLMFDGVVNHVSSQSHWFVDFINGKPGSDDMFIVYESADKLSLQQRGLIFRPRTSDVLSQFSTYHGPRHVWTTFSQDQIDLNYKNPRVLLAVINLLLFYVRHGADIIRLDAVTYLWSEPGTNCVHLKETHEIVKLLRDVLDTVAPGVAIITETNVPHKDNISYFGKGSNEAHMVYNFALPPMVLHTFYQQDTTRLNDWVESLESPSETTCFFNFLDSHDGVGIMAVQDILSTGEIQSLVDRAEQNGALVSYKTAPDGGEQPYEINTTWFSALNGDGNGGGRELQVKRFLASRAVALSLQGVPGIYFHGLLGSINDVEGVWVSGSNRDINRAIINLDAVEKKLEDPGSRMHLIARGMYELIKERIEHRAFHPQGSQEVFRLHPKAFCLLRTSPDAKQRILCLVNVSGETISFAIEQEGSCSVVNYWQDLLSDEALVCGGDGLNVTLAPYQIMWLEAR